MEDYKPNSHRSKAEAKATPAKKKVEKVVSGRVKKKKKNGGIPVIYIIRGRDLWWIISLF